MMVLTDTDYIVEQYGVNKIIFLWIRQGLELYLSYIKSLYLTIAFIVLYWQITFKTLYANKLIILLYTFVLNCYYKCL